MPLFDVRLVQTVEHRIVIEAADMDAVKEFSWDNHEMLRSIGEAQEFPQDNVVISEFESRLQWTKEPHVKLNALRRVQDL